MRGLERIRSNIETAGSVEEQALLCPPASPKDIWDWIRENYPEEMHLPLNTDLLIEFIGIEPHSYDFKSMNYTAIFPIVGSTDVYIDKSGAVMNVNINIADDLDEYHYRWVLAHIYAHFLTGQWNFAFPAGKVRQITLFETTNTININNRDFMEAECNNFAMELLLPASSIDAVLYQAPVPELSYMSTGVPYEILEKQAGRFHKKLVGKQGPNFRPTGTIKLLQIGRSCF